MFSCGLALSCGFATLADFFGIRAIDNTESFFYCIVGVVVCKHGFCEKLLRLVFGFVIICYVGAGIFSALTILCLCVD